MNFKQRNLYVLLDGPMGEYPLKLCFCLFYTKTFAMLLLFFTYNAWKPMHMGFGSAQDSVVKQYIRT